MLINNKEKQSLLRYWTTRYLIVLLIGLFLLAMIFGFWMRHTTIQHRLSMMQVLSEELADRLVDVRDGYQGRDLNGYLRERNRSMHIGNQVSIFIVDLNGKIISANRMRERKFMQELPQSLLRSDKQVHTLKLENGNSQRFFVARAPIDVEGQTVGWVFMLELDEELFKAKKEFQLLAMLILTLAFAGWGGIYFLSRKLSHPIKEVAEAAKEVEKGNYLIHLSEDLKERELHDLVYSFKGMASRLQELEGLRTELLAGVTHELKTPVTSISGLLQALKDGVVTGDEAKEFLEISLKQANRMQTMVNDLLQFNSFAKKSLPVLKETHDLNKVMKEIVHQWQIINEDRQLSISVLAATESCLIKTDPSRLQQILVNLLTNASEAIEADGVIEIAIQKDNNKVEVTVKDNGSGIPEEEQQVVFERFYRGKKKKFKVRGLGLGLPLSKMIANSLGGDLILKESNQYGTSFVLELPIEK